MSALEDKTISATGTSTTARRTYASLAEARGGIRSERRVNGRVVVTIRPMDSESHWQHDGAGKYNSREAMYERIEE